MSEKTNDDILLQTLNTFENELFKSNKKWKMKDGGRLSSIQVFEKECGRMPFVGIEKSKKWIGKD